MVSYGAAVIALAVSLPNFAFASKANRRFETRTELKSAVDQYNGDDACISSDITCNIEQFNDDDACISSADSSGCDVGQTYGWPMNTWDVSEITDMSHVFLNHGSFNEDISDWVVSKVTAMSSSFGYASSFNGDLSKWEVSQVTDMAGMFYDASSFNGDLSKWEVPQVTDMRFMFHGASSFNGDLSEWDISKVTSVSNMFNGASSFDRDLCAWNDKFTPLWYMKMFRNSGCTFQGNPNASFKGPGELADGPFCASLCQVRVSALSDDLVMDGE